MQRPSSKKGWIPAVAFLLFLVLPLYALTAIVVVRSDIVSADGDLTNSEFKAMWTFIASGLATCATVLAAILTKSHNDKSRALQEEAQLRQALLDKEANWRLNLETTLGGLKLMTPEVGTPSKAVIAGGLATIVHLGHPLIALRVLATALDDDEVDHETAAWVLGEGLLNENAAVREEAAGLLHEHAHGFTEEAKPCFFAWPGCVTTHWVRDLSRVAGANVILGLIELLLSRPRAWWKDEWSWVIYTLHEAMLRDPLPDTKKGAATAALVLTKFWHGEHVDGILGSRPTSEVRGRAANIVGQDGHAAMIDVDSIHQWGESGWSRPKSFVPTPPQSVPPEREPPSLEEASPLADTGLDTPTQPPPDPAARR